MSQQRIDQFGTFHITTNARNKVPWLTLQGVPVILIDNLKMTAHVYEAVIMAFCILPDHMHVVVSPGERGISRFMQSFKSQSIRDIHVVAESRGFPLHDVQIRWQKSFHDERITNNHQLEKARVYVEENALHHNLVEDPEDWPWTSLYYPHLIEATHVFA